VWARGLYGLPTRGISFGADTGMARNCRGGEIVDGKWPWQGFGRRQVGIFLVWDREDKGCNARRLIETVRNYNRFYSFRHGFRLVVNQRSPFSMSRNYFASNATTASQQARFEVKSSTVKTNPVQQNIGNKLG